ncbi:MAG TPA: AIR synthase-related protein [Gammaproteobacteria bacterium]
MKPSFPDAGKVPAEFLEAFVYPRCGARRPEVRVGPAAGVDTAVVDLPNGYSIAFTADPVSLVPSLGAKESAWLTVHLLASDITTTGCPPMYALFDLNLPPDLSEAAFEEYWSHVHEFCAELGCAIVGGHTGRFEGQHSTVAGGGVMATVAPSGDILTSRGGRPGDTVLVTRECGISAVAILARAFPETVAERCGDEALAYGRSLFYQSSTAAAALAAVRVGRGPAGVTALHDATEGGVRAALVELAAASGCGIDVHKERIPTTEAARSIAGVFGLDPFEIVSSGALVIAAAPDRADDVVSALADAGVPAAAVGTLTEAARGLRLIEDGRAEPLTHPGSDPYWRAFYRAIAEGRR